MAHRYAIGGSGTGKSSLLKNKIIDDIKSGHGVCFIDPHGEDIDEVMAHIPTRRIPDTILFDPTDPDYYISWNLLQEKDIIPLTSSVITDTIKDTAGFNGSPTAQMEMFLEAIITTLLKQDRTLAEVLEILDEPEQLEEYDFKNDTLNRFWARYIKKSEKDRGNDNNSTYNKFFRLLLDDRLNRILNTTQGRFSVSDAVTNKILLVRLPQGQLGMSKVSLIGSILLSQIQLACLKRDPTIQYKIYIDEVHNFTASIIAEMLSGLRKFNVHITVAHQNVEQLDKRLFTSLMSNCEYRYVFRVSPEDALQFQQRFGFHGDVNLDELNNYKYRTFPWHNTDLDKETKPLGEDKEPSNLKKIRNYTHTMYCQGIKNED